MEEKIRQIVRKEQNINDKHTKYSIRQVQEIIESGIGLMDPFNDRKQHNPQKAYSIMVEFMQYMGDMVASILLEAEFSEALDAQKATLCAIFVKKYDAPIEKLAALMENVEQLIEESEIKNEKLQEIDEEAFQIPEKLEKFALDWTVKEHNACIVHFLPAMIQVQKSILEVLQRQIDLTSKN